ncbi:MAG: hypothetical protein KDC02_14335 [Flavobacteriales bacterium]|nr:hypothetical protein [Flavobacteriales bacterium]
MRTITTLLFGIQCLAPAAAQRSIVIYEGLFSGAQATVHGNWNAVGPNAIWNDRIGSIRVPEGQRVILYEDIGFQGRSIEIDRDWDASGDQRAWAGRVSSIRVVQGPQLLSFLFSAYTRWGGNSGRWERSQDLRITSAGEFHWGNTRLHAVRVDPDMTFHWSMEDGNATNGCVRFVEDRLSGWVQHPGEGPLDFQGEFLGVSGSADPRGSRF